MAAVPAKFSFRFVSGPGPEGKEKQYEDQQFYVTQGEERYEQETRKGAESTRRLG
jgi:hypothetical protein